MNIDYDKFNFLFKEKGTWNKNTKFVTDNFFAFPIKYKDKFLQAIKGLNGSWNFMHHIYECSDPKLCDIVDVHFVSEILENSHVNNSFYKLYRID